MPEIFCFLVLKEGGVGLKPRPRSFKTNGTILKKVLLSLEKQNFFVSFIYQPKRDQSIPGIRTTPSFFLPSILTTIGFSKRT